MFTFWPFISQHSPLTLASGFDLVYPKKNVPRAFYCRYQKLLAGSTKLKLFCESKHNRNKWNRSYNDLWTAWACARVCVCEMPRGPVMWCRKPREGLTTASTLNYLVTFRNWCLVFLLDVLLQPPILFFWFLCFVFLASGLDQFDFSSSLMLSFQAVLSLLVLYPEGPSLWKMLSVYSISWTESSCYRVPSARLVNVIILELGNFSVRFVGEYFSELQRSVT